MRHLLFCSKIFYCPFTVRKSFTVRLLFENLLLSVYCSKIFYCPFTVLSSSDPEGMKEIRCRKVQRGVQ